MKFLILLILLVPYPLLLQAQISSAYENVITDPTVSLRCKELLSEREKKLKLKQKARTLIRRNQAIRKNSNPNKITPLSKLNHNFNKLKQEERLILLKIKTLEESIIRSGCPGIVI